MPREPQLTERKTGRERAPWAENPRAADGVPRVLSQTLIIINRRDYFLIRLFTCNKYLQRVVVEDIRGMPRACLAGQGRLPGVVESNPRISESARQLLEILKEHCRPRNYMYM